MPRIAVCSLLILLSIILAALTLLVYRSLVARRRGVKARRRPLAQMQLRLRSVTSFGLAKGRSLANSVVDACQQAMPTQRVDD